MSASLSKGFTTSCKHEPSFFTRCTIPSIFASHGENCSSSDETFRFRKRNGQFREWSGLHRRQVHAKWRSDEACRAPRGSRSKAPAILLTPSISVGPVTPFPLAGIRFRGPGMQPRYSNGVSACVTRLLVAEHQDNLIFIGWSCLHSQNSMFWENVSNLSITVESQCWSCTRLYYCSRLIGN